MRIPSAPPATGRASARFKLTQLARPSIGVFDGSSRPGFSRPMILIRCDESWAGQILDIFNHAILTSTALYEYKPRTPEFMATWFENKRRGNFPVVGLVEGEELVGFGSFGSFRPFPGYKYTVEHSVYVSAKHRGRGAGKRLLEEIIGLAREQNYHVLV